MLGGDLSRSLDSEHLHEESAGHVTEDHGCHEDAECAAQDDTEDSVELAEEFGSNELSLLIRKREELQQSLVSRNK